MKLHLPLLTVALTSSTAFAQNTLGELQGPLPGDRFGAAVASSFDQVTPFDWVHLIGAPSEPVSPGGARIGRVHVIEYTGSPASYSPLSAFQANSEFGYAVDVGIWSDAQDNLDDILVGAPAGRCSLQLPPVGFVRVYKGTNGALWGLLCGQDFGDRFGHSIAVCPDFTADTAPDFAVGAPNANPGGMNNAGTVTLYDGHNNQQQAPYAQVAQISGTAAGELLGWSVDTLPQASPALTVLVGAPGANGTTGRVDAYTTGGALVWSVMGASFGDNMGLAVAGLGVQSDGIARCLASDGVGNVLVLDAATGTILGALVGVPGFGSSMSAVDDWNGDGSPDFAIGSPNAATSTGATGTVTVYDGMSYAAICTIEGNAGDENFGAAIANSDQYGGDATQDLMVGAPGTSTSSSPGNVKIYEGGTPMPENYCTALVNSSGAPAAIGSLGTPSVANNDLVLTCTSAGSTPGQFGFFVASMFQSNQQNLPLIPTGGYLCVGNPFYRLGVLTTSATGSVVMPLDNTAMGGGAPAVLAGDTWNFQFYFRDNFGTFTTNTSDGLTVTFCQ